MDRCSYFEGMELTEDETSIGFLKARISNLHGIDHEIEAIIYKIDDFNIVIKRNNHNGIYEYCHLFYGRYRVCKESHPKWIAFDLLTTCTDEQRLFPGEAVKFAKQNVINKYNSGILLEGDKDEKV